ncbi:TraC family protein [Nitrosophilus labii]|uniref:TraC family protein n=1 Tax=Nitrosophilus labii TaxID=2706014 RepID=UPI001FE32F9E|nr:TraC family protein [Nitrosophilus labii]
MDSMVFFVVAATFITFSLYYIYTRSSAKEDIASLLVKNWNLLFKRYKITDFLPYRIFDDKENIYINNDGSYGVVLRCIPRIRMGESTAKAVEEMLNKLPDDTFIQFTLIGSKNIKGMVERWRNEHKFRAKIDNNNSELMEKAIDNMAEFFYKKTKEPPSFSMTSRIKNFVLYVSIKSNKKENILAYKDVLKNILKANHFAPEFEKPENLKPILYELFNGNHDLRNIPFYDDTMYINRQLISSNTKIVVKDTHMENDGRAWISLAPQSFPKYAFIGDFGEKIGDYVSKALDTNQFKDTFFITTSVIKMPKSKTATVHRNHSWILGQKWSEAIFRNFAAAKEESVGILDRIDNRKESLFAMDLNVLVSGENYNEASENAQVIMSYWNKGGETKALSLDEALGIHHLNFIAALPMGINKEYLFKTTGKYRTMFPDQVAQFIPLEADYKGNTPNLMLISRRAQIAGFDLFKSNINFNAYLVATSGAGKSVLLNMLGFNSYARGDRVFVLDYDNSFLKLCETIDGQYIFLDPQKPISFNPFSEINSFEELMEDLAYLSDFVYMLGSSKSEQRALEDEKLIKTKLQDIIKTLYSEIGNRMEVTHIRDRIKQIEDQRFQDFGDQLGQYCRGGIYSKFLEGKNQFNIKKEFIVVEFKGIENHPDIRDPIIMLLIYHINQMMYLNTGRQNRIQIILDEAHRFLGKNPRMDDFIEQAYRRARKYDGSIILATQGFDDIYNPKTGGLSKAGTVIVNNSSWKWFMKQTETSINMLINSEVFNFNELDKAILRSITTIKGEYSELFMITPEEYKLPYRLIMDKIFYYLTTTDPEDKRRINDLINNGLTLGEAIEYLVNEEEKAA